MRKRIVVAACAVALVAACTESDQAPTSPPTDPSLSAGENGLQGKPGPHIFLRRGFARKPGGTVNMTFHGGTVLPTSKSMAIFWGSPWTSDAAFTADKVTGLDDFFSHFGGSSFAGTNTEYSGTNGQVTKAMSYLGHVFDNSAPPSRALTVSGAVAEACKITGNNPDPSGVYFIYTSTTAGHVNYCAWHSWGSCGNGAPVQVAYMPNLDGIAGCDPGSPASLGHSQGLAALANVTAHELSEAITDPRGTGWFDASGAENADKCAWVFPSIVALSSTSRWQAQGNWSNARFTAGTGYANLSGQKGCINGNQ
jgi:hypothetical protein